MIMAEKTIRLKKQNRVIVVSETQAKGYLSRGYDSIDDSGKVLKEATGGKNVSVAEFNKVKEQLKVALASKGSSDENEKLKAKIKELEEDVEAYEKENEKLESELKKFRSQQQGKKQG